MQGRELIRGGVHDAKVLNAQLADILAKAKETYKELDKEGRGHDCRACQGDEHRGCFTFISCFCA